MSAATSTTETPLRYSTYVALNNKVIEERKTLTWSSFCATFTHDKLVRISTAGLAWDEEKSKWEKPFVGLPMFSPAHFRDGYADREHHEASSVLGLDYDAVRDETLDQVVARFPGVRCIIHSTFNYRDDHRAFRVLIALSRDVTFSEYRRLVKHCLSQLDGRAAKSVCDASRLWFGPCCPTDGEYHVRFLEGGALDVDVTLASLPPEQLELPSVLPSTIDATHPEYSHRLEWFTNECATCRPPENGGQTFAIASKGTRGYELPADVVLDAMWTILRPRCDPPTPEKDYSAVKRLVERTITAGTKAVGAEAAVAKDFVSLGEAIRSREAPQPANDTAPPPPKPTAASAPPARTFVGVDWATLAKPLPPVSYVVRHFGITKGRPTLLAGYGGLGKTIIVQGLEIHIASEETTCWGLPIANGHVWHFDYEMTQDPLQRRWQRLSVGHGVIPSRLHLVSMPEIYLSDMDAEDALCRTVDGATLGVIDNLAAATASSDKGENDNKVRMYLDRLTRVTSKTGCAFVVLAHERKGGGKQNADAPGLQRVRGASAITDACGSVISITVKDGILTLTQEKTALKQNDPISLKLEDVGFDGTQLGVIPGEDSPGLRAVLVDTSQSDAEDEQKADRKERSIVDRIRAEMVELLRPHPAGMAQSDLLDLVKGTTTLRKKALAELKRDRIVIDFSDHNKSRKLMVTLKP